MKTYLIFIKTADGAQKPLKVKAASHTVYSDGKLVQFDSQQGATVAIFNIGELVGFVESESLV